MTALITAGVRAPGPHAGRVQSPWTGASISLQSLLDASLVVVRAAPLLADGDPAARRAGRGGEPAACRALPEGVRDAVRGRGRGPVSAVHPFVRESIDSLRVAVAGRVMRQDQRLRREVHRPGREAIDESGLA